MFIEVCREPKKFKRCEAEMILVTGGRGFIGHWLVRYLADLGYGVVSVDNDVRGGALEPYDGVVELTCDLSNLIEVRSLFENYQDFEFVFHLAAYNGTQNFYEKPFDVLWNSSIPSANVCKALAELKLRPLCIYTSSSEVYARGVSLGITAVPTSEQAEVVLGPCAERRWSYGAAKCFGEYAFAAASHQYGLPYIITRVHNVYGPRMGFNHFIPDAIKRFRAADYSLPGSNETRSFCFISDAVSALAACMKLNESQRNRIYNIGSSEEMKIYEIAEIILECLGVEKSKIQCLPGVQGSVRRRCPTIDDSAVVLGLANTVSISEGISTMVNWYSPDRIVLERGFA